MLRTGWVVVRRTVRVSSPPRSMVIVSAATWTVTIWRAWMRPEGDLLPGDHDDAGVAGQPLDGDRLGRRAGRRPGGAGAAQQPGLVPGQRAGPGAQQDPGGGVEEHQRVLLDPDGHQHPAEDLRGDVVAAAEADVAVLADHPVDLDRGAGLGRGEGRRSRRVGRRVAARRARSAVDRCERTDLTRAPAMVRWITSVLAQNVTVIPARAGAEPELLAQDLHVPAGRDHPVELHRPAAVTSRRVVRNQRAAIPGRAAGCGRDRGQGQDRQPQRRSSCSDLAAAVPNRSAGLAIASD